MFENLEELNAAYEIYSNKMTELYKEKYKALDELEMNYKIKKCKCYNCYNTSKNELIDKFSIMEDNLTQKNYDLLKERKLYIQSIIDNSIFDCSIIGPSLAKVMSYLKGKNYKYNEEIVSIDMVCYVNRYLREPLGYVKNNFICCYISEDGKPFKQDYPIEYDDSLFSLSKDDCEVLYQNSKIDTKKYIRKFYSEFAGELTLNYVGSLQEFIDELIKYKIDSNKDLTLEKCDEVANFYISKLKDDKPKILVK